MRSARFLTICFAALAVTGSVQARTDVTSPTAPAGPESVPAQAERGRDPRVRADAVLLLAARPRRDALRVRALEEPELHRGRHLLVGREVEDPGRLGSRRTAVADRQPLRGLRPRAGDHPRRRQRLERAVRIQRPLGQPAAGNSRRTRACRAGASSTARPAIRSGSRTSARSSARGRTPSITASSTPSTSRPRSPRTCAGGFGLSGISTARSPLRLPAVSYGPWSPTYTTDESGNRRWNASVPTVAAADTTVSNATTPALHQLTPGFSFAGTRAANGTSADLYRVYVFSDSDCVNVIYRGSVVGLAGIRAPHNGVTRAAEHGQRCAQGTNGLSQGPEEGRQRSARSSCSTRRRSSSTESDPEPAKQAATPATTARRARARPRRRPHRRGRSRRHAPRERSVAPATHASTGAPVDLWDSGWPNGRFYWTAVPVRYEASEPKLTALAQAHGARRRLLPAGRCHRLRRRAARPDRHRRRRRRPSPSPRSISVLNQVITTTGAASRTPSARSCRTSRPPSTTGIWSCRRTSARPAASSRSARAARRSSPARPPRSSPACPRAAC